MTVLSLLSHDEPLTRKVLLAVELINPATMALVSRGVTVEAVGLDRGPIKNWSGRFVWLSEDDKWPTEFVVQCDGEPFENVSHPAPPRPPDLDNVPQRLVSIVLQPTAAYPFADGVTVVRGSVRETTSPQSGIRDAAVWLRWFEEEKEGAGIELKTIDATTRARTNASGDFAALLRIPTSDRPFKTPNREVVVQLVIHREGEDRVSNFYWLAPDGQVSDLPTPLVWSDLQ